MTTSTARDRLLTLVHDAAARLFDETASTGWSQLAAIDVEQRRFRDAESLLEQSLPFTVDRDIPICEQWQTGVRSRLQFERGRWEAGLEDARTVLDGGAPIASLWPHLVAGLVPLRRGEPEGVGEEDHLQRAWELAEQMAEPLRGWPCWPRRRAGLAARPRRRAGSARSRCLLREVGRSGGRSGRPGQLWPSGCGGSGRGPATAVGRRPSGRRRADGRGRAQLPSSCRAATTRPPSGGGPSGRPTSRAGAVWSSDEQVAVGALNDLETMGAWAAADRARGVLRARGLSRVPARRRATTVANPAGLTSRQLDVARLVAKGLTNGELAQKLYISPRTADHHVSAVLTKLGLGTRREIVRGGLPGPGVTTSRGPRLTGSRGETSWS